MPKPESHPRSLHCPFENCDGVLLYDRGGYWRCPDCGSELWWQPLGPPKEKFQAAKAEFTGEISRSMVPGAVAHSGGGSGGRSNLKQLMKKKTTAKLFEELSVSSAADNKHLKRQRRS